MSRNLGRTDCYFCQGAVIPVEPWRPTLRSDCGAYFAEYQGIPVVAAKCVDCEAQYLAWGAYPGEANPCSPPYTVRDLSFRSTFNDEPGPDDLPKWRIRVVRERERAWEPETDWERAYARPSCKP